MKPRAVSLQTTHCVLVSKITKQFARAITTLHLLTKLFKSGIIRMLMNKILKSFSAFLFVAFLLVGCGSTNCPSGQSLVNNVCTVSSGSTAACSLGQVLTAQGCLTQNIQTCGANFGWNGGSCVPEISTQTGAGSPQDASQYFSRYGECGRNMIPGYMTCTCVGNLVYSLQYMECIAE